MEVCRVFVKSSHGIRKVTAAFVSKIGVFSWFSWSLDFGAKMAEFPLPVLQIWQSRNRVAIQIQLMNIHVSECKYYCLHLVPKFGDMCDRQNWRLHQTDQTCLSHTDVLLSHLYSSLAPDPWGLGLLHSPVGCSCQFWWWHILPNLGTKCKQ